MAQESRAKVGQWIKTQREPGGDKGKSGVNLQTRGKGEQRGTEKCKIAKRAEKTQ